MTPRDQRLELAIESASLEAYGGKTAEERRSGRERMRNLIAQRSPERVREIADQKAGKG